MTLSYHQGKFMAGYIALSRKKGDRSAKCKQTPEGLILDIASDGRVIGIEFLDLREETLAGIQRVLTELRYADAETEIAPLRRMLAVAS